MLAIAAALGACSLLVAVAWVASSGVGSVASGERPFTLALNLPTPTSAGGPAATFTAPPGSQQQGTGPNLSWIGAIVEVIALLALAALVVFLLARWLASSAQGLVDRFRNLRRPVSFEPPHPPSALREKLASAREEHFARLTEGIPRNGIVRCWMSFEDAAQEVGVGPKPTETPTEFLTRLLQRSGIDPAPGKRLAGLYHEARFSTHPLSEDDRTAARQALTQLHHQLEVKGSELDQGIAGVGS